MSPPAGTRRRRTKLINDFIASGQYDTIDGIWTSGIDSQVVDAIKAANKPFVPIVGADLGGFVTQLLDPVDYPGLKGAAVTNTAAVGGAGVTLALKLLNGETRHDRSAGQPAEHGPPGPGRGRQRDRRGQGQAEGVAVGRRASTRPGRSAVQIDGWTTYTPDQVHRLQGPGE